jgi:hypothetical protein
MAGDLERFLQEAADRLARKVKQAEVQARPARPKPIRQAERAPVDPEILDAEIVEADVVPPPARPSRGTGSQSMRTPQRLAREQGPNPLSNIDTRRPLARSIDLADERMAEHVQEALGQDLPPLGDATARDSGSQVERREQIHSPLLAMLRQPETLRAAFIASEIFKRKF